MTLAQLDTLAHDALRADERADHEQGERAALLRSLADDLWRTLEAEACDPRDDLRARGLL